MDFRQPLPWGFFCFCLFFDNGFLWKIGFYFAACTRRRRRRRRRRRCDSIVWVSLSILHAASVAVAVAVAVGVSVNGNVNGDTIERSQLGRRGGGGGAAVRQGGKGTRCAAMCKSHCLRRASERESPARVR